MTLTANDLKIKGISIIEDMLSSLKEIVITVRGKQKYVVIDLDRYNYLRDCELEHALHECKEEIKNGDFVKESVEDHISRITKGQLE